MIQYVAAVRATETLQGHPQDGAYPEDEVSKRRQGCNIRKLHDFATNRRFCSHLGL